MAALMSGIVSWITMRINGHGNRIRELEMEIVRLESTIITEERMKNFIQEAVRTGLSEFRCEWLEREIERKERGI